MDKRLIQNKILNCILKSLFFFPEYKYTLFQKSSTLQKILTVNIEDNLQGKRIL